MAEQISVRVADSSSFPSASRREFSSDPEAHYDRVTPAWQFLIGDDLHVGYFEDSNRDLLRATQALTRLMADSAQLSPGSKVLDVGCGTGSPAVYLALSRDCFVTGISTSRVGIARAKIRAADRGAQDRASFAVADGTANGFPGESFDCVWVMESSHLIPQKDLLLRECARVLRRGGTIVLCDLMLRKPIPTRPGVSLWHDLTLLERVYGKTCLYSLEAYIPEFQASGLRAEGRDISELVLPTFSHWRENAVGNASRATEIFGADQVKLFGRSCEILTRLFENGQLGYCLITGKKAA